MLALAADSESTFWQYICRFRKQFSKDATAWARDNIFWDVVMLLVPAIVLFLSHRTVDWELIRTTLWVYVAVFVVYLCVHVVRTPWKLDSERAIAIEQLSGELKASKEALSERLPNFILTTRRLWVTAAQGWIDKTSGVVASLEIHIVNTSPAPGNIRDLDVSVNIAGHKHHGVPITPMYFGIQWRTEKMPGEPARPPIEVYPKDFLYGLIDGRALTQNQGTTKWLPFYVDATREEVEASAIAISITDATGGKFLAISTPDPSRQLEVGYR